MITLIYAFYSFIMILDPEIYHNVAPVPGMYVGYIIRHDAPLVGRHSEAPSGILPPLLDPQTLAGR